ncbi:MAG: LuxR family transcriptional regulator [Subtercola sp.]|nr:LuxR family transcriptional regulator [Subtercola sp.]
MNDSAAVPAGWDLVDEALARIRACRGMPEFIQRSCALVLAGCAAESVALGRIVDGVWVSWLRAGRLELLQVSGALPALPMPLNDASGGEQQVVCFRQTISRELAPPDGRRVLLAAVTAGDDALGLLHVVGGAHLDPQIVQSCADTLGAVLALILVRQRAEEQNFVLASLRSGLGELPERPIELLASSGASSAAASTLLRPDPLGQWDDLTARQQEVLELMMLGLSNLEIAERLVLAVATVKSHVRAVLRASGAVNRSDAVSRFARTRD